MGRDRIDIGEIFLDNFDDLFGHQWELVHVNRKMIELIFLTNLEQTRGLAADGRKRVQSRAHGILGDSIHGFVFVSGGNFGAEFHPGGVGDEIIGERNAVDDLDARIDNGLVLLVGHGHQVVDTLEANPMEGIGHHFLKTSITDTGDGFGLVEILFGGVASLLVAACVVYAELDDLSEGAPFLAEVNDETDTTALGGFDGVLEGVDEVGTAGADVGSENIRANALIMDADRGLFSSMNNKG